MYLTWLADELRAAGLTVVEEPGWKTRGRKWTTSVKGIICHHTGKGSTDGLRRLIREGREDLPGPLSQLFLDEDGTFYVVAAGRSNHAGKGKWQGVITGNSSFIGIEARNAGDGKDVWEAIQMSAYARGCAAIARRLAFDPVMISGHKEYALPKGRKVDPTFDMVDFREDVEAVLSGTVTTKAPPRTVDPVRAMLMKGSSGQSVKDLQKLLQAGNWYLDRIDGDFGPKTETAVKLFQKAKGLTVDGKVGPKTWTALGIK